MNRNRIIFFAILFLVILFFIVNYFSTRQGTIEVTTNPDQSEIILNNATYSSPISKKIKQGKYVITVSKEGYYSENKEVKINSFRTTKINIVLTKNTSIPILDDLLPYSTENFIIEKDNQPNKYTITLYAIQNRPDQYEEYKNQLAQYKKEALDWISNNGVNPDTIQIIWLPE